MNKKIASEIAIGIILLLAIIIGGIFYWQSKKVPVQQTAIPAVQKPVTQPVAQPVINEQQTQTPQVGYKILRVSDGTTAFSFEIPEKWLTETRHSGEKRLTVEEMRDFLATSFDGDIKTNPKLYSAYSDMPWSALKTMKQDEIEKYYYRYDDPTFPFPNASVSSGKYIWYSDSNAFQVDFYIKSGNAEDIIAKIKQDQNSYCKKEGNDMVGCGDDLAKWSKTIIDGKNVDFSTDPTNGEEISKGNTGGKNYYIQIPGMNKTLVIQKQMEGDAKFEADFNNLIQTFKFTK